MPPSPMPDPTYVTSRSLYLYESRTVGVVDDAGSPGPSQEDVKGRTLYLYESYSTWGHPSAGEPLDQDDVLARTLYLYMSIVHDRDPTDIPMRCLYLYEAYTNDEIFPWIERIVPNEQYPGGQVGIYGDGFGDTQAAEASAVRLGVIDPAVSGPGDVMGVVSWISRSPGLYPANSGVRSTPAIVATVPADAESGMVSVEETT